MKCIRGKWNKSATILFSTLKMTTHKLMLIKKYKTKLFLVTKLRIILNVDLENQHVLNFNCDLNWTFLLLGFKCLTIMHRNKIFFISQGFSVRHYFSLRVHVRVNNARGIVVGKWKEFGSQVPLYQPNIFRNLFSESSDWILMVQSDLQGFNWLFYR